MKKIVLPIAVFFSLLMQKTQGLTVQNETSDNHDGLILQMSNNSISDWCEQHASHCSHSSHSSHASHYSMSFVINADSISRAPEIAYQYLKEVLCEDNYKELRLYIAPGSKLMTEFSDSLLSTNDTCLYIASGTDEYIIPLTKTYYLHNKKRHPRSWTYGEQLDWMKVLVEKTNTILK